MRSDADGVKGPLYAYLGHFARHDFLCQGHNDLSGGDDARLDDLQAQLYGGRAPNAIGLPNADQ